MLFQFHGDWRRVGRLKLSSTRANSSTGLSYLKLSLDMTSDCNELDMLRRSGS